tara:strand:- start:11 stop:328 length:318 start_codon:yes stop_codon:yes gene_type:complete
MALKVEYETEFGITCDYAYCVIVDARLDKKIDDTEDGNEVKSFNITYRGKVYASDDAYEQKASPISGFNGEFELDTANAKTQYNLLKQCYLHLKTQDKFTDSIDC